MAQLKESEDFESLLNKVTDYELELLDYADRLLSDKPIPMDSMTAFGTLEMLDDESISLLQKMDVGANIKALLIILVNKTQEGEQSLLTFRQ